MNSGPDHNETQGFHKPGQSTVIEELTAYLDGELDQDAIEQVEKRLGTDANYLAEMQALQQTWDLLDRIPEADPGNSFTQTTMEMVATEVAKDRKKSGAFWKWPLRVAMMVALPALVFALTAGMIRSWQSQADRMLIDDLSVISHFEFYQETKMNNKFVDGLMEVFPGSYRLDGSSDELSEQLEAGDTAILLRGGDGLIKTAKSASKERREFLNQLEVEEKVQLQKQYDTFVSLPEAEQEELREFDRLIRTSKDAPNRLEAMKRYFDWLQRIPGELRGNLRDEQDSAKCLKQIELARFESAPLDGILDDLSIGDSAIVLAWYEAVSSQSDSAIRRRFVSAVREFAKEERIRPPRKLERTAKNGYLPSLLSTLLGLDKSFVEMTLIEDNLEFLNISLESLSTDTRRMLRNLSPNDQRRLVMSWVEAATRVKLAVPTQTLLRFQKTLPEKELQRLRNLPPSDFPEELEKLYLKKKPTRWGTQEIQDFLESGSLSGF